MTIRFGPRLVGATEKTLNAILRRCLEGTGLSEPQWVTLRLARLATDGPVDAAGLADAVAKAAHFSDAADLVEGLAQRGLLEGGQVSARGVEAMAVVEGRIRAREDAAGLWADLAPDDVAATERVLNQVLDRARAALTRPAG